MKSQQSQLTLLHLNRLYKHHGKRGNFTGGKKLPLGCPVGVAALALFTWGLTPFMELSTRLAAVGLAPLPRFMDVLRLLTDFFLLVLFPAEAVVAFLRPFLPPPLFFRDLFMLCSRRNG